MDKFNDILNNIIYINELNEICELEKDRKFCRHDMNHFLDTARIMYIICLEKKLNYSKDIIYAIGLLHDIGRAKQYKYNIPHDKAGIKIAEEVLKDTSYSEEEKNIIIKGIDKHRNDKLNNEFLKIIYESDKLSRKCFICKSRKECYWAEEKKNYSIKY